MRGLVVRVVLVAAGAAVVALLPLAISEYRSYQFTFVGIYFIAIVGLNVVTGYSGQISLGQGAFIAIGAYTTAILTVNYGVGVYWTIPVAGLVTGLIGFAFGFPCFLGLPCLRFVAAVAFLPLACFVETLDRCAAPGML